MSDIETGRLYPLRDAQPNANVVAQETSGTVLPRDFTNVLEAIHAFESVGYCDTLEHDYAKLIYKQLQLLGEDAYYSASASAVVDLYCRILRCVNPAVESRDVAADRIRRASDAVEVLSTMAKGGLFVVLDRASKVPIRAFSAPHIDYNQLRAAILTGRKWHSHLFPQLAIIAPVVSTSEYPGHTIGRIRPATEILVSGLTQAEQILNGCVHSASDHLRQGFVAPELHIADYLEKELASAGVLSFGLSVDK